VAITVLSPLSGDGFSHENAKRRKLPRKMKALIESYARNGLWLLFGMGFLSAWVYSSFFTMALAPLQENARDTLGLYWMLSLLSVSVGLLISVLVEKRFGNICERKSIQYGATLCMALGTVLIALGNSFSIPLLLEAGVVGAILTGLGASVLYIAWGSLYCSIGADETERIVPVAMFLSMLITLFVFLLRGWGTIIIVATFPLLALLFLRLAAARFTPQSDPPSISESETGKTEAGNKAFLLRTAGVIVIFWFIFTYLREYAVPNDSGTLSGSYFFTIAVGAVVAIALIGIFLGNTRQVSFFAVYKTMAPLTCISLLLALLLPAELTQVAYSPGFACLVSFDANIWILSVKLYRGKRASKTRAVGIFRFAIQVGGFLAASFAPLLLSLDMHLVIPVLMTALVCTLLFSSSETVFLTATNKKLESLANTESSESTEGADYQMRCKQIVEQFGLSEREREVLEYLGRGRDLPFIRDKLYISRNTVNTHVKHIYSKFGIHSKQELIDLIENEDGRSDRARA
jgi:DNA-binding CsgD family transcriptional regulator